MVVGANDPELELENLTAARLLRPAVNQLKQPVVHPDAGPYFFIDPNSL